MVKVSAVGLVLAGATVGLISCGGPDPGPGTHSVIKQTQSAEYFEVAVRVGEKVPPAAVERVLEDMVIVRTEDPKYPVDWFLNDDSYRGAIDNHIQVMITPMERYVDVGKFGIIFPKNVPDHSTRVYCTTTWEEAKRCELALD